MSFAANPDVPVSFAANPDVPVSFAANPNPWIKLDPTKYLRIQRTFSRPTLRRRDSPTDAHLNRTAMTEQELPTVEEIEELLHRSKRGRWPLFVGAVVGLAAVSAVIYFVAVPAEEEIHWISEAIDQGDIVLTATATGTLQPRRTVTIGAEISGRIETVEVEKNESVELGQVLATFDTTVLEGSLALVQASLASSRASLRRAEVNLTEARTEEERTRTLVDRDVAPRAELEVAEARRIRAEADLDQARADLQRAQAQVSDVRTQLNQAVITSPIDGVILQRNIEPGMTVASSLQAPELFVAAEDLSRMRLEVWVDEADVGLVQPGQEATFEVSAWPRRRFDATVETLDLAPTQTDNVVTYVAVLTVENDELLLRPGMTAETTIVTGELTDVVRVSNRALRFSPPEEAESGSALIPQFGRGRGWRRPSAGPQGVGTVHVLRDGVPTPIRVETGRTDGRFTSIESDEIGPGDEVLVGFSEGPPEEREGPPGGGQGRRGGPS